MQSDIKFSLSIVSHQSGLLIEHLFESLRKFLPKNTEIIVTLNCPENEDFLKNGSDLPIKVIRNSIPKGFGDNHNAAFERSSGQKFIVVNPDIRLNESPFEALDAAFSVDNNIGACAPKVVSVNLKTEDSVRRYPTFFRLLKRTIASHRTPDYDLRTHNAVHVDWAAGMFVMFDADAFRAVRGFDNRYFMYMEDADICLRLAQRGLKTLCVPSTQVIHDAQRASHNSWKHRRWHIRSVIRFMFRI